MKTKTFENALRFLASQQLLHHDNKKDSLTLSYFVDLRRILNRLSHSTHRAQWPLEFDCEIETRYTKISVTYGCLLNSDRYSFSSFCHTCYIAIYDRAWDHQLELMLDPLSRVPPQQSLENHCSPSKESSCKNLRIPNCSRSHPHAIYMKRFQL